MKPRTDVLGAILAGGKSTRMRTDKSLLFVNGAPLIAHVARAMTSVFQNVVIVADDPGKYGFLKLKVIPDSYKGAGPLAGIHAALLYAETRSVFIASCDTPLLSPSLIEYVLDYSGTASTTIPIHQELLQPLCGVYETKLAPLIKNELDAGNFAVLDFLKRIEPTVVPISPSLTWYSPHMFLNVNRPEDVHRFIEITPRIDTRSQA
ncbi:MAG TPA: molybdenum cofactor guanylyltransferase [Bacteroidota bacterium]